MFPVCTQDVYETHIKYLPHHNTSMKVGMSCLDTDKAKAGHHIFDKPRSCSLLRSTISITCIPRLPICVVTVVRIMIKFEKQYTLYRSTTYIQPNSFTW